MIQENPNPEKPADSLSKPDLSQPCEEPKSARDMRSEILRDLKGKTIEILDDSKPGHANLFTFLSCQHETNQTLAIFLFVVWRWQ